MLISVVFAARAEGEGCDHSSRKENLQTNLQSVSHAESCHYMFITPRNIIITCLGPSQKVFITCMEQRLK